jgi:hypothetical protein
MVYELRSWFDNCVCLYTDDPRVKDLAARSPELQVATAYFRRSRDLQPFAWDIVGRSELLEDIAGRFSSRAGARRRRVAAAPGMA